MVFAFEEDAEDALKLHYQRHVFLARYGRQSVLQWDDVPLSEMNRYVAALADMLALENTTTKMVESG